MKKIRLLKAGLLLVLFFALNTGSAQSIPALVPTWTITQTNGIASTNPDNGRSVLADGSGNVHVTGVLNKVPGTADYHVGTYKYTKAGATSWSDTENGGNPTSCGGEAGNHAVVDQSGNVWVTGTYYDGTSASLALWKYSSAGALAGGYPKIYASTGCTSGGIVPGGSAIAILGSDVYVCGSAYTNSTWYFVVAKNNSSGVGWTWVSTDNISGTGQNEEHRAIDIKVTGAGPGAKIYATGFIFNGNNKDIYTVGLDVSGNKLTGWTGIQYDGGVGDDIGYALGIDGSGNVYVAGMANISGQAKNGFLAKYPSTGVSATFTSLHDRGGAGNGKDDAWMDIEVISGTDPAVFVGGYSANDNGDTDYALRAYTSTGGNATGWSGSPTVVYYNGGSSAATERAGTDQGKAIEYCSTSGRVYITGNTSEPCSTGCATADVNITTLAYSASNGSVAWGPTSYDCDTDAIPDDDETFWSHCLDVYYSLCYASDIVLVTGASLVSGQGINYITIQYGQGSGSCSGNGPEGRYANPQEIPYEKVGISPNPFSRTTELRIESGREVKEAVLYVTDVQGRMVSTANNISSATYVFDRAHLQAGLYFFKLMENGAEITNGKFVITD